MKGCFLASTLVFILMNGCRLAPDSEKTLGVPYRAQEQYNYCAPACVLMWRLYDGLGPISQASIFNWMGGAGCTTAARTADAVRNFTTTTDAYSDSDYSSSYREMIARQITSIDQSTPVIAVISQDHTVVLQGGKWHQEGPNHMWDYVIYHDPDPLWGRDQKRAASSWLYEFCPPDAPSYICVQILSANAASTWQSNYSMYQDSVVIYGGLDPDNQ